MQYSSVHLIFVQIRLVLFPSVQFCSVQFSYIQLSLAQIKAAKKRIFVLDLLSRGSGMVVEEKEKGVGRIVWDPRSITTYFVLMLKCFFFFYGWYPGLI